MTFDAYELYVKELQDLEWTYQYALNVLGGRWIQGESLLSKDAHYAYMYASNVIHGRFPEGEAVISQDPFWAYFYAKEIIQARWLEGESAIFRSFYAEEYRRYFGIEKERANWVVEGF